MKTVETYEFVEPHCMGGYATVTMTREQILKHYKSINFRYLELSDDQIIDEFMVVHWAQKLKDPNFYG